MRVGRGVVPWSFHETRRRFHLVPFAVTIPPAERDHGLAEKFKAEWPGILGWTIDGCLAWQACRLINQSISSCTYSPDRNPDELVWKHLRADTVGRMTITDKADFKAKVRASMCQLQNDPEKIRTKNYRSNMPPDSAFTYGLINKPPPAVNRRVHDILETMIVILETIMIVLAIAGFLRHSC